GFTWRGKTQDRGNGRIRSFVDSQVPERTGQDGYWSMGNAGQYPGEKSRFGYRRRGKDELYLYKKEQAQNTKQVSNNPAQTI
ncbi:MAG TPA: hypothetical protein VK543_16950, partial [Puia sp.]|nr:hypothetical protein [Puia sp.]